MTASRARSVLVLAAVGLLALVLYRFGFGGSTDIESAELHPDPGMSSRTVSEEVDDGSQRARVDVESGEEALGNRLLEEVLGDFEFQFLPRHERVSPLMLADIIARENSEILFSTPREAILASLTPARAAEVIDCLSNNSKMMDEAGNTMSGAEFLLHPMEKPSMPWDPVARHWSETWLMYDGYDEAGAKSRFVEPLLQKFWASPGFKLDPGNPPRLGRHMNPDSKHIDAEGWELVQLVLDSHAPAIQEKIIANGLFESQLAARAKVVEEDRYERVPGLVFGTIEHCDGRDPDLMSLRVFHALNGWATYLVVMKGEDQALDSKLAEVQAAVDVRNDEIRSVVVSL